MTRTYNIYNRELFVYFIFWQDVQTETVLMILLRLAEDVISMDSHLQSNRKKQITQELNTQAQGLFNFFIETLQINTTKYRTLKVKGNNFYSNKLVTCF